MKQVIIASHNNGKIEEIGAMLKQFGMEAVSRDDAGVPKDEVEETGSTLEENSMIKAKAVFSFVDKPVIADDSGLEVDAMDGRPGVYSARYAGDGCSMQDNRDKLLRELKGVPEGERTARFVTVLTMLYPDGTVFTARGTCEGRITTEERGEHGFGYDPLFLPDGSNRTFAEMTQDEKNSLSHRAKALKRLEELISDKEKEEGR